MAIHMIIVALAFLVCPDLGRRVHPRSVDRIVLEGSKQFESNRQVGPARAIQLFASLLLGFSPASTWQVPGSASSLHANSLSSCAVADRTRAAGLGKSRLLLPATSACRRSCTPVCQICDISNFMTGEDPGECVCLSKVFCNREIDLKRIEAIGFDMDFTLASYEDAFDMLAFEGAKQKLVEELGYPSQVLDFEYSNNTFPRGVMIDKELGNFVKADRHKYVRVALHGRKHVMSRPERKAVYRPTWEGVPEFSGSNFVKLDSYFHLVDAELFAQLVDLKDSNPDLLQKPYSELYKDVRKSVDLCHRDGTIKNEVARNPKSYIRRDPDLIPTLQAYKRDGKKLFLLTNSEWDYTHVVMNHLWGNDPSAKDLEWTSVFDVIMCFSCKPRFFTDKHLPLSRILTNDGSLEVVEDYEIGGDIAGFLAEGKIFHGGSFRDLHRMLELTSGEGLLYVGDHMYSDVLKTKRAIGWRTCLIVPELDHELTVLAGAQELVDEMRMLREEQLELAEDVDCGVLRNKLENEEAHREHAEATEKLKEHLNTYHTKFHPVWGQMFRAGYQESLFAKQITGYACLYTSKVANLGTVSPRRHFRTKFDMLPHEL